MPKSALAIVESHFSEAPGSPEELSCDSLFAATMDPTVIVDALRGSVITANVAAARLVGVPRSALAGMPLATMLDARGPAELRAALETARNEGAARIGTVRFRGTTLDLSARLSLVRAGKASYVLAHFSPADDEEAVPEHVRARSLVYEAVDSGAAVLVVTDADFNVLYANRAFLRLIEVDSLQEARGQSLSRWLEVFPADLALMQARMAAREIATTLPVRLLGRRCGRSDQQALAITVPDGDEPMWGFRISDRSRIN